MEENPKSPLINLVKEMLNNAIIEGFKLDVYTVDSSFRFYSDNCGQRKASLQIYSYAIPCYRSIDLDFGIYNIIRRLSFTNTVDEGKEGAVLGTLTLSRVKNVKIESKESETIITLDSIEIRIGDTKIREEFIQKLKS